MRTDHVPPSKQPAPGRLAVRGLAVVAALLAVSAAVPRAAHAYTDTEIASFLQRRFSCPVLAPGSMLTGKVHGATGPAQVFLYGAEGCPRLPFSGSSFAAVVPGTGGMMLLTPQPAPVGVTAVTLRDGYVVATSPDYAPGDPRCCPSRLAAQRWAISGDRLVRAP